MAGETRSWLDLRICDLPRDDVGEKVVTTATQKLLGIIEAMRPYIRVLEEVTASELDADGGVHPASLRSILIARSSGEDVVELHYDSVCNFYGIDLVEGKRRLSRIFSIDMLTTTEGESDLRRVFDAVNCPISKMTLRDLVTGIKMLEKRLDQVIGAGLSVPEELKRLLSE